MRNEQYERIRAYLSQYITGPGGDVIAADRETLRDGIALLIEQRILTRDEIRWEALNSYFVIVPEELFPDEVGRCDGCRE